VTLPDDTAPDAVAPPPDAQPAPPAADAGVPETSRTGDHRGRRRTSFWRELPFLILIALVLALLIKTFLVQAFFIPSGSMENTLQVGDRVLVNKLVYRIRDIHRGEIIVFKGPPSWQENPEFTVNPPSNIVARRHRRRRRPRRLLRPAGPHHGQRPSTR
jgi:signal peptidase I